MWLCCARSFLSMSIVTYQMNANHIISITHFHDHHSNIEKLPEIVFSLPKLEVLCVCAEYVR
jgi:uncharacterized protein (DUF1499 family)